VAQREGLPNFRRWTAQRDLPQGIHGIPQQIERFPLPPACRQDTRAGAVERGQRLQGAHIASVGRGDLMQ